MGQSAALASLLTASAGLAETQWGRARRPMSACDYCAAWWGGRRAPRVAPARDYYWFLFLPLCPCGPLLLETPCVSLQGVSAGQYQPASQSVECFTHKRRSLIDRVFYRLTAGILR